MKIENKFYEATVVDINDTQLSGIVSVTVDELMSGQTTNFERNIQYKKQSIGQQLILARPANKYYDGKVSKYKTPAGTYNSPLKNERIVVFFLNEDINKCYFIPGVSIRGVGENLKGYNLDIEDLNDFIETSRRPYMEVREFYNRNIIGFNNNPDSQHFFFKFDNGSELHFRSPNENDSFTSNKTKPSEWKVTIKRHDSFYQNTVKQTTTQDDSYIEMISEKKKPGSSNVDYTKPVDAIDLISSDCIIGVEAGNAIHRRGTKYMLDARRNTSYSNTITSSQNNTTNNETYKIDDLNSNTTMSNISNIDASGYSHSITANNTNSVSDEIIDEEDFNTLKTGLFNKIKKLTFKIANTLNLTHKINILMNKGGMSTTKIFSILNEDVNDQINIKNKYSENNNKDGIIQVETHTKAYVGNPNKYIKSVKTNTTTDTENSTKLEMISDEYETVKYFGIKRDVSDILNDVESEECFNTSTVKRHTRNPADANRSLDLDPLFTRGHKLESFVKDDKATTQLVSVKESSMGSATPTMGFVNSIKLIEEGTSARLEIDLKDTDTTAGVKLVLSSDNRGVLSVEVPQGDVEIKSDSGNISAITKTGNVAVEGDVISIKAESSIDLEAGRNIKMKANSIELEAGNIFSIKSSMLNMKADTTISGSNFSVNSRYTSLGSGASNALINSTAFSTWANGHFHISPTSGGPTTPATIPMGPAQLSQTIFNK